MRCFANEFGRRRIKVNALAIGTRGDIANVALWLASDESVVTCRVPPINGGPTLPRNPATAEIDAAVQGAKPYRRVGGAARGCRSGPARDAAAPGSR